MSNIDHTFIDDIVCPWCGEVHMKNDGFPSNHDGNDYICQHCNREFMVNVEFSYKYSTVKIEPQNAEIQD